MIDLIKYQQNIEYIKLLEYQSGILHEQRDILWELLDNNLTKTQTRKALAAITHRPIMSTKDKAINRFMTAIGFEVVCRSALHYSYPGSTRRFRVRGNYVGIEVQASELPATFDRWANSIDFYYYLTDDTKGSLCCWVESLPEH